jgi:putative ABC transport system ATP-binding protein
MLSAEDNIKLPMAIAGEKPDADWLDEVIHKVGLSDRRTHKPSELSGGQQQRVAIGRALLSRPTILFADEPTGNLDSTTSEEVLEVMRESVDSLGQTTMMVTHDATAAAVADRVLFLADGCVVEDRSGFAEHDILATIEELGRR